MDLPSDPVTVALVLSAFLLVIFLGCVPTIRRVLRIRRLERKLGRAYWPFVHSVDMRDQQAKWCLRISS